MRQVIVDKEIKIEGAALKTYVEEMCASYENSEDMVNMYLSNPQIMQQIEPMVVEQQAIEWVIENGTTKVKKISFQEFMNAPAS